MLCHLIGYSIDSLIKHNAAFNLVAAVNLSNHLRQLDQPVTQAIIKQQIGKNRPETTTSDRQSHR